MWSWDCRPPGTVRCYLLYGFFKYLSIIIRYLSSTGNDTKFLTDWMRLISPSIFPQCNWFTLAISSAFLNKVWFFDWRLGFSVWSGFRTSVTAYRGCWRSHAPAPLFQALWKHSSLPAAPTDPETTQSLRSCKPPSPTLTSWGGCLCQTVVHRFKFSLQHCSPHQAGY